MPKPKPGAERQSHKLAHRPLPIAPVTTIVDNSPIRQANYRIRWETHPASA